MMQRYHDAAVLICWHGLCR